jgi:hypothetical protein
LYFSYYCDDGRARVSSGIKPPAGKGGFDPSLLKKSEQLLLSRVEDAVVKYIIGSKRLQAPLSKTELEMVVSTALGKTKREKGGCMADFERMIEDMRSGNMLKPKDHTRYKPDTIANYVNTL